MLVLNLLKRILPHIIVAISAILILIVIINFGPDEISQRKIGPIAIQDYASLKDAADFFVYLFVAISVISYFAWKSFLHIWYTYFRPSVGYGALSADQLAAIGPGLDTQVGLLARRASWPEHDAAAAPAKSVRSLDFGDAALTTKKADRKVIRTFLSHTRRDSGSDEADQSILILKGEPGAGKSILTQEIHASLVEGLKKERHSLIPIVLFASDFRLSDFTSSDGRTLTLREFVITTLLEVGQTELNQFAKFLSINWGKFDLLIIIDGLDEIAQRSAYTEIQSELKKLILSDIFTSGGRVRRFIMSCRTHDDLGMHPKSPSISLRGLANQDERERFCESLVRARVTSKVGRSRIEKMLRAESAQLSSSDLFRRNPYFLSLLVDFLSDSEVTNFQSKLDFRFIMNEFLKRESNRYFKTTASLSNADTQGEIYRQLNRLASIFCSYLAYSMSASNEGGALYNSSRISEKMISGFGTAIPKSTEQLPSGHWKSLGELLEELSKNQRLSEVQIREFSAKGGLYENDIRLLADLARDITSSPSDAIFAAFGQIALEGRLEKENWFRALASQIAIEIPFSTLQSRDRLAVQLFARGLVAAHALRLVYIDQIGGLLHVRFRHRRLAEYFAACYFTDRWEEFERLNNSPWLAPVLNLVAAIEGDKCRAFSLLANRVVADVPDRAFEWRSSVTDAAESAAFTHKGPKYREVLQSFVSALINATYKLSLEGAQKDRKKRDLASQFSAINAIGFVGELDSGRIALSKDEVKNSYQLLRRLPAPFVTHTVRAAFAINRLTTKKIPIEFRFDTVVALLGYPSALVNEFRSARRYGFVLEWCVAALAFIIAETIAYSFFCAVIAAAVTLTTDQSSTHNFFDNFKILALPSLAFWFVYRLLSWRRSATSANHINRIIVNVLAFVIAMIAAVVFAPFALIYAIIANARNIVGWMTAKIAAFFVAIVALTKAFMRWLIWLRLHYRRILFGAVALSLVGGGLWGLGTVAVVAWQEAKGATAATNGKPNSNEARSSYADGEADRKSVLVSNKTANNSGSNAEVGVPTGSHPKKCASIQGLSNTLINDASRNLERAADVEKWRQGLTDLAIKIVAAERVGSCLDWWKDGPVNTATVFKMLREKNMLAVPIRKDRPATFNLRDFLSLRALMQHGSSAAENPARFESISGISGLKYFRRANQADEAHSQIIEHFNRLDEALLDGSITTDPSGKYLDQDAFMQMMTEVSALQAQKEVKLRSLSDSASDLRWEAIRALGRFAIVMFGLLGCWILIRGIRRDQSEKRYLEDVSSLGFEELLKRMNEPNISDRVRTGLASILSEMHVERSQISSLLQKLEFLIQKIEASDKLRDIRFAAELTIALDRISRRFA